MTPKKAPADPRLGLRRAGNSRVRRATVYVPPRTGLIVARSRDPELEALDVHEVRTATVAAEVCERIAATVRHEEKRSAAVAFEVRCMGRKPRNQN